MVGAAFAAFVDSTSVLEFVSFRHCRLSRLETQCVAKSLSTCQHLRALNLWDNNIDDRGAAALGDALGHNFGLHMVTESASARSELLTGVT